MSQSNVIIIGPPGSGKTTVGKILARRFSCVFHDTDGLIESSAGKSVSEIFSSSGETEFRRMETEVLKSLLQDHSPTTGTRIVLATGGGIAVKPGNFELLADLGTVIGLTASADTLADRLHADASRPLLQSAENSDAASKSKRLQQLLTDRKDVYAKAHHTVETAALAPEEVANRIESLLKLVDSRKI